MPRFRQSLQRLFAFLAALLFVAVITIGILIYSYRDVLLKTTVEFAITEATGFRTEIETLQHEWPATFMMRGVRLDNPSGYSRVLFARAPYFYIDLDLEDIWKRRSFHIREWRLVISELHLEKSKEGIINGALLKSIKSLAGSGGSGPGLPFLMDRLDVKIQRITYRDRTGVLPKKITKRLYLPARPYENVTDFKKMIEEIQAEVLRLAGPARLVMLSPFVLEGSIKKAAVSAKETPVVAKTGEILKNTASEAKDKIAEVAEATKAQLGF